jgi:hypothetical protein
VSGEISPNEKTRVFSVAERSGKQVRENLPRGFSKARVAKLTKVAAVLFVTVLQRFTSRLDSVISVDVAASNFASLLSAIVNFLCKNLTLTRTKSGGVTIKRHNNQHNFLSGGCPVTVSAVASMFPHLGGNVHRPSAGR